MEVSIKLLKLHPKEGEYFSDLAAEKFEDLKRSIAAHGIRDPIKVLPDYTVVAGHQRLRAAEELGLEKVPIEILNLTPEEAEYLLIADNTERRGEEQDPIKKAKQVKFLAEYWRIREGSRNAPGAGLRRNREGKFCPDGAGKTLDDIAKSIGQDTRTTKNLLSLNNLIPEYQGMVSAGTLKQSAAYALATLSQATQKALLDTLGKKTAEMKVAELQELKRQLAAQAQEIKEADAEIARLKQRIASGGGERLAALKARLAELEARNAELRSQQPEVVNQVVEAVYESDYAAQQEIARLTAIRDGLAQETGEMPRPEGKSWLEREIDRLEARKAVLEWDVERNRAARDLMVAATDLFRPLKEKEFEFLALIRQTKPSAADYSEVIEWMRLLARYLEHLKEFAASGARRK